MTNTTNHLAGIILAAGLSSRAGEFKPLMEFNGEPAVHIVISKLRRLCKVVIVVTGNRADEVEEAIATLHNRTVRSVTNHGWERGMFSSMQAGVAALPDGWDFFLHMVDQPHIPASVYSALLDAVTDRHDVYVPTHDNRRGHPLLCCAAMKERILSADAAGTLRDVLRAIPERITLVPVSTDAVLHTINTPEDAQAIRTYYSTL